MRVLGPPVLLKLLEQTGGVAIAGSVLGGGLGQQRLREAGGAWVGQGIWVRPEKRWGCGPVKNEGQACLGREEDLPSPRWDKQPCDITPQAPWGRTQPLFVSLCCPRSCSPEY